MKDLRSFAADCERDQQMAALWRRLSLAAHDLLQARVAETFASQPPGVDEATAKAAFRQARAEMAKACVARGIQPPNLSLKSFSDQILTYS